VPREAKHKILNLRQNSKKEKERIHGMLTKEGTRYRKFIKEFSECAQSCYECFGACLDSEIGKDKNFMKVLLACARTCESAAIFMCMDGKFIKQQCELCAMVCDVCAQDCSRYKEEVCQTCAQECRACAEKCREMMNMT
jgi:hypothetical protein